MYVTEDLFPTLWIIVYYVVYKITIVFSYGGKQHKNGNLNLNTSMTAGLFPYAPEHYGPCGETTVVSMC